MNCPFCDSDSPIKRGIRSESQRYQCGGCKRYFSVKLEEDDENYNESSYEEGKDFINVVCSSPRIMNEKDIIERFHVDIEKWEIERFKVKTSEGYRKDRKVDWHVLDGKVISGDVEDSGNMLVVPLFHIEARFIRKTSEIRARLVIKDIVTELKEFKVSVPKISYPKYKNGLLYEIDIPDIHFGRLAWSEESGEDYDVTIARESVIKVTDELLGMAKNFPVSKILLPLGNDFFNVNDKTNTTSHGTPQQEDTRWQKTFVLGRHLLQDVIERCASIAPTDVLIIPGNHDEERMFYMGDALSCKYDGNPNITIDNSPKQQKYVLYGKNLIGFAHGYNEKLFKLPAIMANAVPELWGKSKYREWHTGDKHHKFDSNEDLGVVVRILRSLAVADAWTFNNGFIGAVRAAESFLWDDEKGLIAQFTARP